MKKILIGIIPALVFSAGALEAHKLEISVTPIPPVVVVEAGYAGHEHPLSEGEVFIYAPGESEAAFQTGKLDSTGKFAFIPEREGTWKVVVDDGTGHKSEVSAEVAENFLSGREVLSESEKFPGGTEPRPSEAALYWKALIGISLLIGIAGIIYGVLSRRKSVS